jgi:hydroxymethylpyrimidine/phosphomethylpyrimidine kinase
MKIPRALTIAGSDSGGCAGIQADLKTFAALGVHGMSAITSVTAQDTTGVHMVSHVPPENIEKQIDAVIEDIGVDAVKTGMLPTSEIIALVVRKMKQHRVANLVVDPVMLAQSGDPLIDDEAIETLKTELFPLATVVTPNLPEAERLLGGSAGNAEAAAREIREMGPSLVVVKGGHSEGEDAIDTAFDGRDVFELRAPRIDTRNTHGSGCTFASAIAANLARGAGLREALVAAKDFVEHAITKSLPLGRGSGPLGHFYLYWDL